MTKRNGENGFLRSIKRDLDALEQELDPTALNRLRTVREHALTQASSSGRRMVLLRPLPLASGLAAAVAVVVAMAVFISSTARPPSEVVEDMELLTAQDSFEVYDDMEFYRWLEGRDAG